jgi:hypothetical protein
VGKKERLANRSSVQISARKGKMVPNSAKTQKIGKFASNLSVLGSVFPITPRDALWGVQKWNLKNQLVLVQIQAY